MTLVASHVMRTIEGFNVFLLLKEKPNSLESLPVIHTSVRSDYSVMSHVRDFSDVLDLCENLEYVLEGNLDLAISTPQLGIDVIITGLGFIFFWCCMPFVVKSCSDTVYPGPFQCYERVSTGLTLMTVLVFLFFFLESSTRTGLDCKCTSIFEDNT